MKKAILIGSITIVMLLSSKAHSQTVVSAGGVTIKLTNDQIAFLHKFKHPAIEAGLKCINIKYNSTADLIIALLKADKKRNDTLYIASQKIHLN